MGGEGVSGIAGLSKAEAIVGLDVFHETASVWECGRATGTSEPIIRGWIRG